MASLVFTSGPNAGRRYPLEGSELLVGRRSDCQVHIPDLYVSRHHARLRREGAQWIVEDLGSKSGTYVNGERIRRPAIVEDCDELGLARSAIRVELPPGQGPGDSSPELALIDLEHPRVYVSSGSESQPGAAADPKRTIRLLQRQLSALRSILELSAQAAPSQIFDALARELLALFPRARAACVLAAERDEGEPRIRSLRRRDAARSVEVPRMLLDHLAESSGGVLLGDDLPAPPAEPDEAEPAGARMGAPIHASGEPCGVLYVESEGRELSRDDLALMVSVAGQVGLVLEAAHMQEALLRRRRLERDLQVARQIQRSLLPDPRGPQIPGLDVAIHYAPAYEIGGDFYDFIWHDTSRIAFVVGDVAGKAVSAALYMARLTSELRSRRGLAQSPSQLLSQVNEAMYALGDEGMFATLVYALYDVQRRELVFTNAGHVTPLLRREGRVFSLHAERAHVPPLGVVSGAPMGEGRALLRPGDLLLFATDGICEARDGGGTEYGTARLARRLADAGDSPQTLVQSVLRDVGEHVDGGAQGDDMTLLALSVQGEACGREGPVA